MGKLSVRPEAQMRLICLKDIYCFISPRSVVPIPSALHVVVLYNVGSQTVDSWSLTHQIGITYDYVCFLGNEMSKLRLFGYT